MILSLVGLWVIAAKADTVVGKRLFRETRFAQYFYAHSEGVNAPLREGDPVLASGPYAGKSMNCAQCHLSDELKDTLGTRAFADFARRSPIPERGDGKRATLRNTPGFVNAFISREPRLFLHYDGEFTSVEELVQGGFTGRNFGWLPAERAQAIRHIARVVREDDGQGGLPYRSTLGLDVAHVSDVQVLEVVATKVADYLRTAVAFDSPYDDFLRANELPAQPRTDERDVEYGRALLSRIDKIKAPKFVPGFGAGELKGLKSFLGPANCIACHAPPAFTDFGFHNTGAAQDEYELLHGGRTFGKLPIPLKQGSPELYAAIPEKARPELTDLGLWNAFGEKQRDWICNDVRARTPAPWNVDCTRDGLQPFTVARFKTPGLRELVYTGPYLHTGNRGTIDGVVRFYAKVAIQARLGLLVNPDPELASIQTDKEDRDALILLMKALSSAPPRADRASGF